MLNSTLQEMRGELKEVDALSLKSPQKEMAKNMHDIYEEVSDLVEKYEISRQRGDLNCAFKQIEVLMPAFVLNYDEILG